MIRYYSIFAVLLIYFNATDAHWFYNNVKEIKRHLYKEKPSVIGKLTSSLGEKPVDVLCDRFSYVEKETICNYIRDSLVHDDHPGKFASFVVPDSLISDDTPDPYKCKDMSIEYMGMEKPMYWCMAKKFITTELSDRIDVMEGFFCAGSLTAPDRVYVFRYTTPNGSDVSPIGEHNEVEMLRLKYQEVQAEKSGGSSRSRK